MVVEKTTRTQKVAITFRRFNVCRKFSPTRGYTKLLHGLFPILIVNTIRSRKKICTHKIVLSINGNAQLIFTPKCVPSLVCYFYTNNLTSDIFADGYK